MAGHRPAGTHVEVLTTLGWSRRSEADPGWALHRYSRVVEGAPVSITGTDGFVDDTVRELAYQAADLVVLSFRDGYRFNSGTLMDAASHERPVLVSSGSLAAEQVERWGAGAVFGADSAASLAAALDTVDLDASRRAMARMRVELSNRTVAASHLPHLRH